MTLYSGIWPGFAEMDNCLGFFCRGILFGRGGHRLRVFARWPDHDSPPDGRGEEGASGQYLLRYVLFQKRCVPKLMSKM